MQIDEFLGMRIERCAALTPDAGRAARNLARLAEELAPRQRTALLLGLPEIAHLFSASQFLANFSIARPDVLFDALRTIDRPVRGQWLKSSARESLTPNPVDYDEASTLLRAFKRFELLRLTLRYLTGRSDIIASMEELTALAEVCTDSALMMAGHLVQQTHGAPPDSRIAIIGLGKMGGMELNYSSDIDLIAVYDKPSGRTSGVMNASGLRANSIGTHEYHCKVIGLLTRLLSSNDADGIVFRVDWRLRPQGQKGELAISLDAYRQYYKTYGRTWERLALIRARPVAGDEGIGLKFMRIITPFVWHETFERVEFEEIRVLKKRIDGHGTMHDIKRGYGGIREAEFFVQVHQLLSGHKNEPLRTYRLFNAMQALRWLGIVPMDVTTSLWESYLFLRAVEHHLQMRDDLQTYELPEETHELETLGRHMGYRKVEDFLVELRTRRMKLRSIYNSLLGTAEDKGRETADLLDGGHTEREFERFLELQHFMRPASGASALVRLRALMDGPLTMAQRELSREVVPAMLDEVFTSENPDRALAGLEGFMASDISEARLRAIATTPDTGRGIVKLYALAPRISGLLVNYPLPHNGLRTMALAGRALKRMLRDKGDFSETAAGFRAAEELSAAMHFLLKGISAAQMMHRLSHAADLVMRAAIARHAPRSGCAVIAMGKWGGRELTVGSDLDLVFISSRPEKSKWAEDIIKALGQYTARGVAYSIDARLRPDGTKGVLCKDLKGYSDYYDLHADSWELQALLRARPVGGDCELARGFVELARRAIVTRGPKVQKRRIDDMRARIIAELAQEHSGIDIKYGPGGLGEIEFFIQWLELQHSMTVQSTCAAICRLGRMGALSQRNASILRNAHGELMTLLCLLRLADEVVLDHTSEAAVGIAGFMGHKGADELMRHTESTRQRVLRVTASQKYRRNT